MGYRVDVASRRVEKEITDVEPKYRERVITVIIKLGENPRPRGCKKLEDIYYRVRVSSYRIIYAIFDDERVVVIHRVTRRSESTYRDF